MFLDMNQDEKLQFAKHHGITVQQLDDYIAHMLRMNDIAKQDAEPAYKSERQRWREEWGRRHPVLDSGTAVGAFVSLPAFDRYRGMEAMGEKLGLCAHKSRGRYSIGERICCVMKPTVSGCRYQMARVVSYPVGKALRVGDSVRTYLDMREIIGQKSNMLRAKLADQQERKRIKEQNNKEMRDVFRSKLQEARDRNTLRVFQSTPTNG